MDQETHKALAAFKIELEDRIFKLRPIILALPDDAMRTAPDEVHEAFRQLHSLKGAAGLLNLRPIEQLAHKLEDILAKVRKFEIPLDRTARKLLMEGVDRIEEMGLDFRKLRLRDVSRDLAKIDAALKSR